MHDPEAEAEAQAAAHQLAELLFNYVLYVLPHRTALIPFMTHEDMLEYGRLDTVIAAGADSLRPHKD
ncbi:hypothetical protein [Streptomyces globisporus]|uniref:hypothetical protein n=1 Tax=Streptomyces globisporus TaxID=1908 RepID=UPI0036D19B00